MIYVGLDLSTTGTGVGVMNDEELLYYELIKPKSTIKDWEKRVDIIARRLNEIFNEYEIEEVYVEDIPLKDGKPTIKKLACVRGVVIATCAIRHIPLNPRGVSEWRQDAGFFDGTTKGMTRDEMKAKAIAEVKSLFNIDVNDDVAEAILIGYRSKYPIKKSKPKTVLSRK